MACSGGESSGGVSFVALDALLAAAQEQLEVGQMVQSSTFSLFDAMSAVEVGNPKMDAGARPKADQAPLAARALPLDLSKRHLVAWMDRLLSLEATWHVGGALAQTVYASLHMMLLGRLGANPTMAGYARGTHALCQEVNALVLQGCVCEEEDFMCFATGLPLEAAPEGSDKVLGALSLAIDAQETRDGGGGGGGNAAAAQGGDADGGGGGSDDDARLSAAIVARLNLRKLLFTAVVRMRQRTKQDLDAAAKCLARAASELATVRASAHLGALQGAGVDDQAWAALGFDPGLNAHLAPPAPPRVVTPLSCDAAMDYFATLIEQLLRACRVAAVSDFYGLEAFVTSFSALQPVAVARAALHFQLAQHATLEQAAAAPGAPPAPAPLTPAQQPWAPSAQMMRAATACLHGPGPGVPDLGDDADMFIEQALIAVGNWIQAKLMNPARHRRRLRRGLEDWVHLYQHAVNADCSEAFGSAAAGGGWAWRGGVEYPGPLGPLSCWVERQTARVLVDHLMLGTGLELYEPRDLSAILWYVDYLFGVIESDSHLLASSCPSVAAAEAAERGAGAARPGRKPQHGKAPKGLGSGSIGGSGGGGSGSSISAAAVRAAITADQVQGSRASACRRLAGGVLRMVVGLEAAGILAPPPLPFNGPAERFEQRFGSFYILTRPAPLTHDAFVTATNLGNTTAADVLGIAAAALGEAAAAFQALASSAAADYAPDDVVQELTALEKVAQKNRLACMVAQRATTGGSALEVAFDNSQHAFFPVAVLKSRKT